MTRRAHAPPGIARFDSAAGMARALGAFLHDEPFDSLTGSGALDRILPLVNQLPRRPREWFYAFSGSVEAVPRREILDVPELADALAAWLGAVGLKDARSSGTPRVARSLPISPRATRGG